MAVGFAWLLISCVSRRLPGDLILERPPRGLSLFAEHIARPRLTKINAQLGVVYSNNYLLPERPPCSIGSVGPPICF
jgi:hypothetical protein